VNFVIDELRERLPPEMLLSEREAWADRRDAPPREPAENLRRPGAGLRGADRSALGAIPCTRLAPLVARAGGDAMFPRLAQHDAHAPRLLSALDIDPAPWLRDRASVFGVLARTAVFRRRALDFFQRRPCATGLVLGAGLSHYHQWLDNGRNLWIDADLPEVTALRQRWLPVARGDGAQRLNVNLDVTTPGWWQRLALPSGRHAPPLLAIVEGLVTGLQPAQVHSLLRAFDEFAPPGTRLLLDSLCWLAVDRRTRRRGAGDAGANVTFGLRRPGELIEPHRRLRLDEVHPVMGPGGSLQAVLEPAFRFFTGVPYYAVYELGVDA